jgi:hypothetical protein
MVRFSGDQDFIMRSIMSIIYNTLLHISLRRLLDHGSSEPLYFSRCCPWRLTKVLFSFTYLIQIKRWNSETSNNARRQISLLNRFELLQRYLYAKHETNLFRRRKNDPKSRQQFGEDDHEGGEDGFTLVEDPSRPAAGSNVATRRRVGGADVVVQSGAAPPLKRSELVV